MDKVQLLQFVKTLTNEEDITNLCITPNSITDGDHTPDRSFSQA